MTTDTPRTDALETQCERENMTRDAPWELARTLERDQRRIALDVIEAVENTLIKNGFWRGVLDGRAEGQCAGVAALLRAADPDLPGVDGVPLQKTTSTTRRRRCCC